MSEVGFFNVVTPLGSGPAAAAAFGQCGAPRRETSSGVSPPRAQIVASASLLAAASAAASPLRTTPATSRLGVHAAAAAAAASVRQFSGRSPVQAAPLLPVGGLPLLPQPLQCRGGGGCGPSGDAGAPWSLQVPTTGAGAVSYMTTTGRGGRRPKVRTKVWGPGPAPPASTSPPFALSLPPSGAPRALVPASVVVAAAAPPRAAGPGQRGGVMCWNFMICGACEFGGACTFSHDDTALSTSSAWSVVATLRRSKRGGGSGGAGDEMGGAAQSSMLAPRTAATGDLFGPDADAVDVSALTERPDMEGVPPDSSSSSRLEVFKRLAMGEPLCDAGVLSSPTSSLKPSPLHAAEEAPGAVDDPSMLSVGRRASSPPTPPDVAHKAPAPAGQGGRGTGETDRVWGPPGSLQPRKLW